MSAHHLTITKRLFFFAALLITAASCRNAHIKEHNEWGERFKQYGITSGCFMLRDHTHEAVHLYNKDRCLQRFTPASTFKIFNSLAGLETAAVQDELKVLPWDSVVRWNPDWNKSMNMREAFKVSNIGYYQEIARRVGKQNMQHYLDTVKYGNMKIGGAVDSFWIDNSLQISADEQVGFLKRLYFDELPFNLRAQTIVRSLMLQEDSAGNRVFYKTGWGDKDKDTYVLWVVGFTEHREEVKEHKNSMNKSDVRNYPYIFALNFDVAKSDKSHDWFKVRIELLHKLLEDFGAFKTP